MVSEQSSQSALLDAIYGAAIEPKDYLEFAKVWDATILKLVENDRANSLSETADTLELRKHFARAFEVFEKSRLGQQQSLQSMIDSQAFASALCRSDGQITVCNASFSAQFGLGVGGNLSALSRDLERMAHDGKDTGRGSMLALGDEHTAYRHYDKAGTSSLVLVERFDADGANGVGRTHLVRSTKLEWSPKVSEFLQSTLSLTQAEAEIAGAILKGMRIDEIAQLRERKAGTVRQQVKTVMEKCGVHSQAALMALLVSLHHLFAAKPDVEGKRQIHCDTATRIHETVVKTSALWGTIDFEIYGDPRGQPVAFFHSQMSSARPTKAMIEAMAKAGLLVFAPRKPGLGETSMEKQDTDPVGFVAAFVHLMEDSGYTARALLGQGMSGVAVVEYAAQAPDFTGALVTIDTGIPFTRREQFEHMPPVSKRIFWTVWDCPELFYAPFAFASEAMQASESGERTFMDDQFKDIPHDHALIEDPAFYALARQSMRDFMSTPKRSADELVHWMHDWTDALDTACARLPVLFLQSEHHDFLRADAIREYLAQRRRASTICLEDTAQLCVFERPDLIARKIATFVCAEKIFTDNAERRVKTGR